GGVPHRLALDHRRHRQLREAERRARDLAGLALPLADPHFLVRPAVGDALRGVRGGHARHRSADRVAAPGPRGHLVRLSDPARLAPADRSPTGVPLNALAEIGRAHVWTSDT